MEPECSLPHLQVPATRLHLKLLLSEGQAGEAWSLKSNAVSNTGKQKAYVKFLEVISEFHTPNQEK